MLKIESSRKGKGFFKKEILYDTDREWTNKISIFGIPIFNRRSSYTIDVVDEANAKLGYNNKV